MGRGIFLILVALGMGNHLPTIPTWTMPTRKGDHPALSRKIKSRTGKRKWQYCGGRSRKKKRKKKQSKKL